MTRAKALLIVVGDPAVLSPDPLWRSFLNYIHQSSGWTGPPPSWDTSADVDDSFDYAAQIRQEAEQVMQALAEQVGAEDSDDADDDDGEDRPFVEAE